MIFYLIILAVIFTCLLVITIIIINKFPQLNTLDLEAMKQHKQKQVKVSIVEERLERKLKELKEKLIIVLSPLKNKIISGFSKLYQKIVKLQKQYQEEKNSQTVKQENKETLRQKINTAIAEAEELIKQNKLAEAEKKYIEAIALDKQNIETYKGLGDLYILRKDYELALETLEFIKQINPEDEIVWRQLGTVCDALGNNDQAVKCYKKAVDLAPNNPKNLDLLIDICIKAKDRYLAQSTLQKLEEVNPDNQKIEEYKKQIEEL